MTAYQEIRATGKALQIKIMEATKNLGFKPSQIAKQMTLPIVGRTLLFDNEAVQNAFFDFWYHEFKLNGKSLVESVDPIAAGLLPLEAEFLDAHRQSRTSFFDVVDVLPQDSQIRLKDLLRPGSPEVLLTDMGFSSTMARTEMRSPLFIRLLCIRGFTITSGMSFIFPRERIPGLIQAYGQKTKRVSPPELSAARFIFFFQKYRAFGLAQNYQDVV